MLEVSSGLLRHMGFCFETEPQYIVQASLKIPRLKQSLQPQAPRYPGPQTCSTCSPSTRFQTSGKDSIRSNLSDASNAGAEGLKLHIQKKEQDHIA